MRIRNRKWGNTKYGNHPLLENARGSVCPEYCNNTCGLPLNINPLYRSICYFFFKFHTSQIMNNPNKTGRVFFFHFLFSNIKVIVVFASSGAIKYSVWNSFPPLIYTSRHIDILFLCAYTILLFNETVAIDITLTSNFINVWELVLIYSEFLANWIQEVFFETLIIYTILMFYSALKSIFF